MDPNQTPQPQQLNPIHTPTNPSKNSKIVPIGLGIIVVLVIAIGAYVLGAKQTQPPVQNTAQPSPIPSPTFIPSPLAIPTIDPSVTANWKTYNNPQLGIVFKYPTDWQLNESGNIVSLKKEVQMKAQGAYPAQKISATINIYSDNISSTTTLEEWLETSYSRGNSNLFKLIKEYSTHANLDNAEALEVIVPGGGGYIDKGILAIRNNKGYRISIIGSEIEDAQSTYQAIKSTFKFTP